MKSLQLPGVPVAMSRIGLGCMRLNAARESESFEIIDGYMQCGGNLFDTAEIYGSGGSEVAIGNYFRRNGGRANCVIVTKGCVEPKLVRPDYIRHAIEASLERLQIEAIDVYLLHRDDPSVPVGELLDVLNGAIRSGRVRSIGASNWTTERLAEANREAVNRGLQGFVVSSPHLALATPREAWWAGCRHATLEDLHWYREQRMTLLGWSTQCRGFFSKDPPTDTTYLAELIRVYYSRENLEKRQRLLNLAERYGVAPGTIAVAYVLALDLPTVALVGPLGRSELVSLLRADEIALSREECAWLDLNAATLGAKD